MVIGKPLETMGRKVLEAAASKGNRASPLTLCPSDCDANHGKLWDSKVTGPNAGVKRIFAPGQVERTLRPRAPREPSCEAAKPPQA